MGESARAAILSTDLGYRDFLQAPLQPLMDNLEAQTYETFERDSIKYIQYQRAVAKALVDRVPDEKASELTTVSMVVGAGRGPLSTLPSENSLGRWMGESARAAILSTDLGYRDFLQAPLQPLMDNLEAQTYETFERDSIKYIQYQRAVAKALVDRVPDEKASELTTVSMVVGAGRGPLVRASLQSAEETGRKMKVYAVEKNPNAVVTLDNLVKMEGSCDMRFWSAPEKADILVSELLGSFGDNELSPECLDGAQRFLKPDGISIPSSYVKAHKDLAHFETAYVVKLHSVAKLAPSQSVCLSLPSAKANNQRYKKLHFNLPSDAGSALVHGFAGYFDSVLYKDVHLGSQSFFLLRKPVEVHPDSPLEVHFWRCCGSSKRRCSGALCRRLDCNNACSQSISESVQLFPFYWTSKAEKSNGGDGVDESDGFEESEQTGDGVLSVSQKLPHESKRKDGVILI
ncbi:hypothetical protein Bca52824_089365 [Brassica carinata]|uniref:Protein arginine N-methyltransferase 1.5 n=1 Tax=Brassica carinata TaxID=52824 RepID=A0A8X7TPP8_BRACI|nr:hypothetical protein Bca52824_089365 [Brassica carinata]